MQWQRLACRLLLVALAASLASCSKSGGGSRDSRGGAGGTDGAGASGGGGDGNASGDGGRPAGGGPSGGGGATSGGGEGPGDAGEGGDGTFGGAGHGGGGSDDDCDGCRIGARCFEEGARNPDDPCELCRPADSATTWSAAEGATCDDGEHCTVDDRCESGLCRGMARPCSDGIACNGEETCDEAGAECVPGTNQCLGAALCDATEDRCVDQCAGCTIEGTCYAAAATAPNDACRICDPVRSESAWSPNDGAACDDERYCTVNDRCAGTTCAGDPRPCSDEVACNGEETCDEGIDECVAGASPCDSGERCNEQADRCDPVAVCGNSMLEPSEACDDGVNDGGYGGCMPGCASRAPRCGDGNVDGAHGELCDGDCPSSCNPTDSCDVPVLSGSALMCNATCTHTPKTSCTNSDACCPSGCTRTNDSDCTGPTFDVEVWADNTNRTYVRPTMLEAPFNSYARIRWRNVGSYPLWIVNFGSGSTWSQLAILGPGATSTPDSTAEGPWCGYDFGGTYRLGPLNYPTDEYAILELRCIR